MQQLSLLPSDPFIGLEKKAEELILAYAALIDAAERILLREAYHLLFAVPGTYAIWYEEILKYYGKTDSLKGRSFDHFKKINSSILDVDRTFICTIPTHFCMPSAVETHLIARDNPEWNKMGFGNKMKGKNREGQTKSAWELRYMPENMVEPSVQEEMPFSFTIS